MNDRLRKKMFWVLAGFTLFTLFFTVFGERGLIKIYKLRREIKRLQTSMEATQKHNLSLREDIQKIQNELAFQERSVRETLGWAEKNEIIYEFSD